MLMGTYQPVASLEHVGGIDADFSKIGANAQSRPPEKLDQVWCFPASTWKEAFMHSLLTAPNCPQAFILLDTDSYRRIDKVRHYTAMAENDGQFADERLGALEDPNCPDDCSELIITPEELGKARLAYIFHPALMKSDSSGVLLLRHGNKMEEPVISTLPELVGKRIQALSAWMYSIGMTCENEGIESSELALFEKARRIFMFCWLPIIHQITHGMRKIEIDLGFPVMEFHEWLNECSNRMARWSYGKCDREEYLKILEDVKLPLSLPDGFDRELAEEDGLPGRNEPCVCGSGRKFKKCHGRIFA